MATAKKREFVFTTKDIAIMTQPVDDSVKQFKMSQQAVYSRRYTIAKHFGKSLTKATDAAKKASPGHTPSPATKTARKVAQKGVSRGLHPAATNPNSHLDISIGSARFRVKSGTHFHVAEDGIIVID